MAKNNIGKSDDSKVYRRFNITSTRGVVFSSTRGVAVKGKGIEFTITAAMADGSATFTWKDTLPGSRARNIKLEELDAFVESKLRTAIEGAMSRAEYMSKLGVHPDAGEVTKVMDETYNAAVEAHEGMSKLLTDNEIRAIERWYSSQHAPSTPPVYAGGAIIAKPQTTHTDREMQGCVLAETV